jgi:hypothetical protein
MPFSKANLRRAREMGRAVLVHHGLKFLCLAYLAAGFREFDRAKAAIHGLAPLLLTIGAIWVVPFVLIALSTGPRRWLRWVCVLAAGAAGFVIASFLGPWQGAWLNLAAVSLVFAWAVRSALRPDR